MKGLLELIQDAHAAETPQTIAPDDDLLVGLWPLGATQSRSWGLCGLLALEDGQPDEE